MKNRRVNKKAEIVICAWGVLQQVGLHKQLQSVTSHLDVEQPHHIQTKGHGPDTVLPPPPIR